MKGLYITTSDLRTDSGGGKVSNHELNAMMKFTHRNASFYSSETVPFYNDPWFFDYWISNHLIIKEYDLVHFRGNPFISTYRVLRHFNDNIVSIVSVPAHDLERSIEEFKLLGLEYPYRHMTEPSLWDLYTLHIRKADMVIYPSKMSRDYLVKKLNLENKSRIIPHGCYPYPFELIKERYEEINDEPLRVGYIGALGPDKGATYLINAVLGMENVELWLGGHSSVRLSYLSERFSDKIKIYGTYATTWEFSKKIDVYVQPSITEGFGLPVLEMMGCGVPVIVSKGAGVSELVTEGMDGLKVPYRDIEAIKKAITYFKDHRDEVERMGKIAYRTSLNYTWDRIEDMLSLIHI